VTSSFAVFEAVMQVKSKQMIKSWVHTRKKEEMFIEEIFTYISI